MYIVKTLREFVHIDDDGKDQGANGERTFLPLSERRGDLVSDPQYGKQYDRKPKR